MNIVTGCMKERESKERGNKWTREGRTCERNEDKRKRKEMRK